jgi:uncharacterized membrane protein
MVGPRTLIQLLTVLYVLTSEYLHVGDCMRHVGFRYQDMLVPLLPIAPAFLVGRVGVRSNLCLRLGEVA